jgi:hypothetical protein
MIRKWPVGLLLATTLVALTPLRAAAQEIRPTVRERIDVNTNTERREEPVRVQVGINLFFPGPTGEGEDAVHLRDRVRRSIYEMAAGECAVVEQVLAKTCRLESINVNINISRHQVGQPEGYQASGNFALRITLK